MNLNVKVLLWILLIVAIAGNAIGFIWNFFDRIFWYDEVLHLFTTWIVTLLSVFLLSGKVLTGESEHPVLLVLVASIFGLGLGALWEMTEWTWYILGEQTMPAAKRDPFSDLFFDAFGAIIAGLTALKLPAREV